MGQLTARQALFVDHYAVCGNAAEAARASGYSADTSRQIGSRLLSNVDVKAALQARRQVFQAELEVTRQDVVNGILSAIELGKSQQNPAVMISGLVQIAKMLGFYEPEVIQVGFSPENDRLKAKFAAMSDDELIAIAAGRSLLGQAEATG
jgi:hypothetical protein